MSDKTPKRPSNSSICGFSSVILHESPAQVSPQKNLTGLPRVVRDLVADVYNNIQEWNDLHIKGSTIVKEIASLKADNPKEFSSNLEQLTTDLYSLVQSLRHYKDVLIMFSSQMRATEKLQQNESPLFISLNLNSLANLVESISKAYEDEFKVKEFVLENIAHSKNKDEALFLAALWTYQYKISDQINMKLEVLLLETGHRKFT
ncbi:cyclin-dependent kinase 2-interacting protein-like [Tribolium madens]|uniref:cyclin-dependent kinase 2-interacting protein-like n=1 Tax=Tribolium madens TaxID=41895 RepID=UPI001CF756E6|nr:cyclin-dependent kinase 2-interacting protein-like [Tribolium madens]